MTRPCDGCGKRGDCFHAGATGQRGAWLGYDCGCGAAFAKSTVHYTKAEDWAQQRRECVPRTGHAPQPGRT